MKALLVANPRAGSVRGAASPARIEERLRAAGLEVRQVAAAEPHEVPDALREALRRESPSRTRVIVVGGDGTIHAALPALIGARFPMAILPLGSVNVLARELGVPRTLGAAIAVAVGGRLRQIDLGVANGRPFALMAGMGFDAAVVHSVAPHVKSLVGSFAYVARGLRVLAGYSSTRFRITTERGQLETDAWLAVVANARRYTYRWRLCPRARIDDGWLDVCVFESGSAAQAAGQVVSALIGRHANHRGVRHLRARELRFECDPPVHLQLDGDASGETPTEVGIVPRGLTVVVPARG